MLVIPTSSAESEGHFSGAGCIVKKDRGLCLESTVVYCETVRKEIIYLCMDKTLSILMILIL